MHIVSKRLNSSLPPGHDFSALGISVPVSGYVRDPMDGKLRTPRPLKSGASADILFRVELALSRMENGDYGYCVTCDHPISIERLEEDPSAVVCNDCRKP